MNNGILFLSSLILLLSVNSRGCERDLKFSKESNEVSLACIKCDKYLLTMNGSFKNKDIFFWQSITKPSELVASTDVSSLLPVSSLPSIKCPGCKEVCCEPVWHAAGDTLKAAYKVIAAKKK